MSQVLGISITDLEIASVVADSVTGEVLARNFVELTGPSPGIAFDAIYQLVESAPITPSAITIACSDSGMQLAIDDILAAKVVPDFILPPNPADSSAGPIKPAWFARTTVVGTPLAFAELATTQFGSRGVVVVADLDTTGALFTGQSVALIDTSTRTVVGASAVSGFGERLPVTEPEGAQTLADAIAVIPNPSNAVHGVVVVGPGAQVLGVAPSLEYALQLPVQLVDDPQYAAASGAAMVAAAAVGHSRDNNRWVLLSASAGAALLLAVGVIIAVVMTGGSNNPETVSDDNSVTATFSSTTTTKPVTTSKGLSRISSPTMSVPASSTRTIPAPPPAPPTTVTQAPPPITVTQPPPPVVTTTTTTSEPPEESSEEPDPDPPTDPSGSVSVPSSSSAPNVQSGGSP
ncbi:hypothetical protein KXR83_17230 [Williamsia muralis]|uniref:hypothetical protein n=1 Tax=Williamsia marianensis TaxID=85044 RepID=UPI003F17A3A6